MRIMYSVMVLLLVVQQRGVPPSDLPQSRLEAFADRPATQVVWSKMIGHLESQEARATITALILHDPTSTPSEMRGIRIDLAHTVAKPSCSWKYVAWTIMCKRANAVVYVEEGQLEAVRRSIERGAAQLRPCDQISQYKMKAPGVVETGLIVCGYQFAGRRPDELAELFKRAITELRAASR
jgi:hypothetical protein